MKRRVGRWVLIVAIGIIVAACADTPPYVDRPYEINREDANFPLGPDITEDTEIRVCYNARNATREGVTALAQQECAKAGLNAVFSERRIDLCPVVTPAAAIFVCTEHGAAARQPTLTSTQTRNVAPEPIVSPVIAGDGRSGLTAEDVSTSAKSQPFPTFLFSDPARQP